MSTEAVIRHSLSLHSNLAFADDNDVITSFPVTPAVSAATVGADGGRRQGNECPVLQRAAHSIMLSLYRNQCIHVFVCPAIVAIAVTSCKDADWIALGEETDLSCIGLHSACEQVYMFRCCDVPETGVASCCA